MQTPSTRTIKCFGVAGGTALALLTMSGTANAATFTDRAAFNSVLGNHSFIDFEKLVGTPEYPGGSRHSVQNGGITIGALHFVGMDDPAGNAAFIIGPSEPIYSMGSFNALSGYQKMLISLAGGATAFGFDVGQPAGWGTGPLEFTISVRPVNGVLTQVANQTGAQGPNFFGYTGDAFDQVQVTGKFGYYVYFDNVAFGDAASTTPAVPEPATWAMLIAGFGLVGSAARRRRNTLALA